MHRGEGARCGQWAVLWVRPRRQPELGVDVQQVRRRADHAVRLRHTWCAESAVRLEEGARCGKVHCEWHLQCAIILGTVGKVGKVGNVHCVWPLQCAIILGTRALAAYWSEEKGSTPVRATHGARDQLVQGERCESAAWVALEHA